MKIGLIDVDGHAKKKKWGATVYPNLALAKIAAYHKSRGDSVEWYEPMFSGHCDKVYMSKIFNFSKDYEYAVDADEIVRGGTGYDIKSVLPQEIDDMQPDFSIYPFVPQDMAYGFLTRGCPNKCPWCVVPIKEGKIRPYWDIEKVANGRKKIVLMDNNILAAGDYAHEQLDKIISLGYKVDFNQALDARLVTEDFAKQLAQIKWIDNQIRFGCDTKAQIAECERAMEMINRYGYGGKYFLYTMLNDNFQESYDRVNYWRQRTLSRRLKKIMGGVMTRFHLASHIEIHTMRITNLRNGKRIWQDGFREDSCSFKLISRILNQERTLNANNTLTNRYDRRRIQKRVQKTARRISRQNQ